MYNKIKASSEIKYILQIFKFYLFKLISIIYKVPNSIFLIDTFVFIFLNVPLI